VARAQSPGKPAVYTQREAIRIVLSGNANIRRAIVLIILFFAAISVIMTWLSRGAPHPDRAAALWAFIVCLVAAIVPGALSGMMIRRAKRLWLTAGKARLELFTTVEAQCWQLMFFSAAVAALTAVPMVAFEAHLDSLLPTLVAIVILPLSCGAGMLYMGLLCIRGNRFFDILMMLATGLYMVVVVFSAAAGAHVVPVLVGVQIVLLPIMRAAARWRWTRIDWMLLRLPLTAQRMY
jgi:hypothetical protein